MASHKQQHSKGKHEDVEEECLSVHSLIDLNNVHSLVEYWINKHVAILIGKEKKEIC